MALVHLELLGGFHARLSGGGALVLPSRKAQALLAYLALPAGRPHSRDKLMALLWGETTDTLARQSLRQTLTRLRRSLGEGAPALLTDRQDTIALAPEAVRVDALEFEGAIAAGDHASLERAAVLYQGDLLEGINVDEAPFEEWRVVERERLRELALEGLARLLVQQTKSDTAEPAIQTALRILAMDPLQEVVHRALMRLFVRQGRRAAALHQYQECVASLGRELGTEPEEETRQLYREILRGTGGEPRRPAGGPAPGRAAETPLIGRVAEMERLGAALARTLDVGGGVVIVAGEAGIGKSRLLQEFAHDAVARGSRVLRGRCNETEQVLPLHPWIDALRGDRATLDPGLRDRLGAAAGAQLARVFPELLTAEDRLGMTGPQQTLLFDAVTELIGELASEQPLVLVIEDVHWTDVMSSRFLAYVGRRLSRLPVLVLASLRPEELVDVPVLAQALKELRADGRLDEITLQPLSETDTRRLATSLHPGARRDREWGRIANEVWAVSEGNPFVVVESVRALQQQQSPESWVRGPLMTRTIQEFVGTRLDRLAERPRQVVTLAAAIGQEFPFALLSRAARIGEREAADAIEELVRRRVLDAVGDRLDFCHEWIRRVAYERLLPSTRAVLHGAIGEALEELHAGHLDDVADRLGYHYSRAGHARRAIPHLIRFAELAGQRYALEDANATLQQAAAVADTLPPGERDRWRLDVVVRQCLALSLLGRHREVFEILRAHTSHVTRLGDPGLAAEYYFRLALTHLYFCEHAQGQLAAEQALREAERSGDPERIGKALHVLSLAACYALGDPERGIAHATRAIPLLDRPHTQHYLGLVHHDLFVNHILAGSLDAALEAVERLVVIGRATGDARLEAYWGYAGWVHILRGDYEHAIAAAQQGHQVAPERLTASLNTGVLGHAYLEQGDAAVAIPLLEQAVETLGSIPIRWSELRCRVFLGEAYLMTGDATRARETAGRALELAHGIGWSFGIALAQRALGRIARAAGDPVEAESCLTKALGSFGECRAAFEAARTRLDFAALLGTQGNTAAAREHLAAALAPLEAANAPKRVAEARNLARTLGVTLP